MKKTVYVPSSTCLQCGRPSSTLFCDLCAPPHISVQGLGRSRGFPIYLEMADMEGKRRRTGVYYHKGRLLSDED